MSQCCHILLEIVSIMYNMKVYQQRQCVYFGGNTKYLFIYRYLGLQIVFYQCSVYPNDLDIVEISYKL